MDTSLLNRQNPNEVHIIQKSQNHFFALKHVRSNILLVVLPLITCPNPILNLNGCCPGSLVLQFKQHEHRTTKARDQQNKNKNKNKGNKMKQGKDRVSALNLDNYTGNFQHLQLHKVGFLPNPPSTQINSNSSTRSYIQSIELWLASMVHLEGLKQHTP